VLALAVEESRVLVTVNVRDFHVLARQWARQGRVHAGILLVSTRTFPQTARFESRVVAAIVRRVEQGSLPPPDGVDFL